MVAIEWQASRKQSRQPQRTSFLKAFSFQALLRSRRKNEYCNPQNITKQSGWKVLLDLCKAEGITAFDFICHKSMHASCHHAKALTIFCLQLAITFCVCNRLLAFPNTVPRICLYRLAKILLWISCSSTIELELSLDYLRWDIFTIFFTLLVMVIPLGDTLPETNRFTIVHSPLSRINIWTHASSTRGSQAVFGPMLLKVSVRWRVCVEQH